MINKLEMQPVERREFMKLTGAGAAAVVATSLLPGIAKADAASVAESIKKIIGGKSTKEGKITLEVPQIAENGRTVPVGFDVASPMTDADHVKAVHVFASGNPRPDLASYFFTTDCAKAKVSTRVRLAKTQNIVAIAEMSDGSVYMAKSTVKVTIGGCGG